MADCPTHCTRTYGTKREVYAGKAMKTRGGLQKKDLALNKRGRVVSVKKMEQGRAAYAANPVLQERAAAWRAEPPRRGTRAGTASLNALEMA